MCSAPRALRTSWRLVAAYAANSATGLESALAAQRHWGTVLLADQGGARLGAAARLEERGRETLFDRGEATLKGFDKPVRVWSVE